MILVSAVRRQKGRMGKIANSRRPAATPLHLEVSSAVELVYSSSKLSAIDHPPIPEWRGVDEARLVADEICSEPHRRCSDLKTMPTEAGTRVNRQDMESP